MAYDVATLAEHMLDDKGGERPAAPPMPGLRPDTPDFRWLRRWNAEEKWAASEHPWISDIGGIAENAMWVLTCKGGSLPA